LTDGTNGKVLGVNIVTLESGDAGLADARNVKAYVDAKKEEAKPTINEGDGIDITSTENASTGHVTYTIGADLKLVYIDGTGGAKSKLKLTNTAEEANFGEVEVDKILENGFLQSTSYDASTGYLTLTFATATGGTQNVEIDLRSMIDINDMSIDSGSTDYLTVTLTGTGEADGSQAKFGAHIVDPSTATSSVTGLADAYEVKQYVEAKSNELAVTANGDDYVSATVDAQIDNKHVIVDANVLPLSSTAGTVGVYDASGAQTTAPQHGSLSGTENSLADADDIASKVKTYVDGEVAIEAARADAKVKNSIYVLDSSANDTGTNVYVKVTEEHGLLSAVEVTEKYAEISYDKTNHTWTNTDNVSTGLATGQHIAALKDYVDAQTTDVAVTGQGDNYVNLAQDANDHKKLNASINTGTLTVTTTQGSNSTITGTQHTLVDGSELATKVSSYVEARLSEEVNKLDASVTDSDAKNYVNVEVVEENGKLTSTTINVSYGTFDPSTNGVATTEDVQQFVDKYDFWETFS